MPLGSLEGIIFTPFAAWQEALKIATKTDDALTVIGKTDDLVPLTGKNSKTISSPGEMETLAGKKSLEEIPRFTRILGNGRTLDDMAEVYAKNVQSNTQWKWVEDFPNGELLTRMDRDNIRSLAIEKGLIPKVPIRIVPDETSRAYRYAGFREAGQVKVTKRLPKSM